jgi:hypothetical protein
MITSNRHPDYAEMAADITYTTTAIAGQVAVKKAGQAFLPATGGMIRNWDAYDGIGALQYASYKSRARFHDVTRGAQIGILGLAFEKDPTADDLDEVVTDRGRSLLDLARSCVMAVCAAGRHVLLVDAGDDGVPYITEYSALDLVDWNTDRTGRLVYAAFREYEKTTDPKKHETSEILREYTLTDDGVLVQLGGTEIAILRRDTLPIVIISALGVGAEITQPPMLPVAQCAVAAYQLSADYRLALHMAAQPTPYARTDDDDAAAKIHAQGIGSGALWVLPYNSEVGYLEVSGAGIDKLKTAIDDELTQARALSVSLVANSGQAEAAQAIRMRASSQHATIYSILDAVSDGITDALAIRAEWGGLTPQEISIKTDFTAAYASEQMINAVNVAVNAGNLPRSVLFELARKAALTTKSDEEILDELDGEGA